MTVEAVRRELEEDGRLEEMEHWVVWMVAKGKQGEDLMKVSEETALTS